MSPIVMRERDGEAGGGLRIDLAALTPERLAGQSAAQIERIELRIGRRAVALAELFDVAGSDAGSIVLALRNGARYDRIGAGLTGGEVRVDGDAGAYLGFGASGGRIVVAGDCGDYCAASLRGGAIEIGGSAGSFLAAALPGEHAGMSGGSVHVHRGIGERAADHMRRGLIMVEGDAGDYAGSRMGGGTLAIAGSCGARLARGDTRARRWVGDLGFGGQGEILHWPT